MRYNLLEISGATARVVMEISKAIARVALGNKVHPLKGIMRAVKRFIQGFVVTPPVTTTAFTAL
jgi:hypothetical protein